jgi:hypothetical protein
LFDFGDERGDEPADAIIVRVVFSVLKVVAVYDPRFSLVCLYFPVVEVDLFEELLLMEF